MYEAIIFDLDGTLVQTEKLKAASYARAAIEMCPRSITEEEVIEAFKEVVGRSRQEVATFLIDRFDLEAPAAARKKELGVGTAWQAFSQIRLRIYDKMLADPEVLTSHRWPHNIELLQRARRASCRTGLATMSHREQAWRVLTVLHLQGEFDFVATRDDVDNPKPHPEIYLLVANELGTSPQKCLVIEDSPTGVQAAKSAGMGVIAVTTPFTRDAFRKIDLIDRRWIVDDPGELPATLKECLKVKEQEKSKQES